MRSYILLSVVTMTVLLSACTVTVEDIQPGEGDAEAAAFTTVFTDDDEVTTTTVNTTTTSEMPAEESVPASLLSSPEDIGLTDLDGSGTSYSFEYDGKVFSASYSPDNWQIVDSYLITDHEDMKIICQALIDIHPIHGRDMESFRTADDMVDEWLQHNLAYSILSEDHRWKSRAKDVDFDPEDQGRTMYEMFLSRTGE